MDTDEFYYICGFQEGGYASHSLLVYEDMYYGPLYVGEIGDRQVKMGAKFEGKV
jgi:hypothetical protein